MLQGEEATHTLAVTPSYDCCRITVCSELQRLIFIATVMYFLTMRENSGLQVRHRRVIHKVTSDAIEASVQPISLFEYLTGTRPQRCIHSSASACMSLKTTRSRQHGRMHNNVNCLRGNHITTKLCHHRSDQIRSACKSPHLPPQTGRPATNPGRKMQQLDVGSKIIM